jgi:hemoglobin
VLCAGGRRRLPNDPEFRATLRGYMQWAVAGMIAFPEPGSAIPAGRPMPHWSWDGLDERTHRAT